MSRIKYEFDFMSGLYVDETLLFNRYKLNISMYATVFTQDDQVIAFERMEYLINDVVGRSVFCFEDDAEAMIKLNAASIPYLSVPSPGPYDQIILMVLMTKLNAILEEYFIITECEISSELGGYITYMFDDSESEATEYVSEDPNQWWNDTGPRFLSLSGEDTTLKFDAEKTWAGFGLLWSDEDYAEEYDDEDGTTIVEFTPEATLDPAGIDPDSNIVVGNFNKKD